MMKLIRHRSIQEQQAFGPGPEGVDLGGGPDSYKRSTGAYDAEAMRAARPATQGLLIIYPLDPDYLGVASVETVIALALSLPQTSDAGTSWVVNSMVFDD
jgi:hypothetical protein